jgi:hypothetical protein
MNRLAYWMMRLYPKPWRARYGDELTALLADSGADARVVADLVKGGIRMQFSTWSFGKLAVTLGVAGWLLCAGLSYLIPNEFTSKATMQITPDRISESSSPELVSSGLNERIMELETVVVSRDSLSRIINDPRLRLYHEQLKDTPLEDVIDEMRRNISVNLIAVPDARGKRMAAFDIVFTYFDRYKAQQTVQALMDAFDTANAANAGTAGATRSGDALYVLSPPSVPFLMYPKPSMLVFCGFGLGILSTLVWRRADRTGLAARSFGMTALVLALVSGSAGYGVYKANLLGNVYRSVATLRWQGATPEQVARVQNAMLSRTSLSMLVNDRRLGLYREELRTEPMEAVIATMKQHVKYYLNAVSGTSYIDLSFEYGERDKVQPALAALLNGFAESRQQLFGDQDAAASPDTTRVNLDVLDAASLAVQPTGPNRFMIACAGGVAGVLIAAAVAVIRRRWKPEPEIPADAVTG